MKAAIMCHNDRNWVRQLSTVLLVLRTHVHLDTKASPAEYLYGTTLRIPGEFFLFHDFAPNPKIFREHMKNVRPVPVTHRHKKRAFFFNNLHTCTHVFLKVAAVKKPLERPYTGPHEVLERTSDKVSIIKVNGSPHSVSTDLLKPTHFIPSYLISTPNVENAPTDQKPKPQRPALKTYVRKQVKIDVKPKTL